VTQSKSRQISLLEPPGCEHASKLVLKETALYDTPFGAAFLGDSLELMKRIPDSLANLVITSPPYALHFKKEYGNVAKDDYVNWFLPFATEIKRILKEDGSFVLNIGGSYEAGQPTRSLYHFKLLVALCEDLGFHLAQECFWYNPAKLPSPAEWVTVRRMRLKDSVEYVWWLSPSPWPIADNRQVLEPYSRDMERLFAKGYRAKKRPSGHNITHKFTQRDHGGSIPPSLGGREEIGPLDLLIRGNNESNSEYIQACKERGIKVHPARFPAALPDFFIRLLTRPGDLVVDPFAGSNTTGRQAEDLGRRWLAFELEDQYLRSSALRFGIDLFSTTE
jgi:DNA modification methylase